MRGQEATRTRWDNETRDISFPSSSSQEVTQQVSRGREDSQYSSPTQGLLCSLWVTPGSSESLVPRESHFLAPQLPNTHCVQALRRVTVVIQTQSLHTPPSQTCPVTPVLISFQMFCPTAGPFPTPDTITSAVSHSKSPILGGLLAIPAPNTRVSSSKWTQNHLILPLGLLRPEGITTGQGWPGAALGSPGLDYHWAFWFFNSCAPLPGIL